MNSVRIPRDIDSQIQILFWELDEFLVFFVLFGVGIVLRGWATLVGLVAGYYAVKFFKKFKEGGLDGALAHIFYGWGVMPLNKIYEDGMARVRYY